MNNSRIRLVFNVIAVSWEFRKTHSLNNLKPCLSGINVYLYLQQLYRDFLVMFVLCLHLFLN